jgi:hypothetical protein
MIVECSGDISRAAFAAPSTVSHTVALKGLRIIGEVTMQYAVRPRVV